MEQPAAGEVALEESAKEEQVKDEPVKEEEEKFAQAEENPESKIEE